MERVILYDPERSTRIDALLNPESLTWRRRAGLRERTLGEVPIAAATLAEDPVIYTGGGLTELSLELLFDTRLLPQSTSGPAAPDRDVRALTAPLWALTEPDPHSAGSGLRPQRLIWAEWSLLVIATAISERFEEFTPGGIPRRAWVNLELRRVNDPVEQASPEAVSPVEDAALLAQVEALTQSGASAALADSGVADLWAQGQLDLARGRADLAAFTLFGDARHWPLACSLLGIEDPLAGPAGVQP